MTKQKKFPIYQNNLAYHAGPVSPPGDDGSPLQEDQSGPRKIEKSKAVVQVNKCEKISQQRRNSNAQRTIIQEGCFRLTLWCSLGHHLAYILSWCWTLSVGYHWLLRRVSLESKLLNITWKKVFEPETAVWVGANDTSMLNRPKDLESLRKKIYRNRDRQKGRKREQEKERLRERETERKRDWEKERTRVGEKERMRKQEKERTRER